MRGSEGGRSGAGRGRACRIGGTKGLPPPRRASKVAGHSGRHRHAMNPFHPAPPRARTGTDTACGARAGAAERGLGRPGCRVLGTGGKQSGGGAPSARTCGGTSGGKAARKKRAAPASVPSGSAATSRGDDWGRQQEGRERGEGVRREGIDARSCIGGGVSRLEVAREEADLLPPPPPRLRRVRRLRPRSTRGGAGAAAESCGRGGCPATLRSSPRPR